MKKFLPMCMVMFFILFNYTILRNTKDALVLTAPGSGAEILSSLKFYVVMPAAVLFVVLYAKLANLFSRDTLFVGIIGVFVAFFLAFGYVIYPNIEHFHPSLEAVNAMKEAYPRLQAIIPVWGVWTYSTFYVLSELWGSVMLSLLFWQFANDIVKTEEAKRFYSLFGMMANISLIFAGTLNKELSNVTKNLPVEIRWGVSLEYITLAVAVAGLVCVGFYLYLTRVVLKDPRYQKSTEADGAKKGKSKPKLGVAESFKYIFTNPYIGLIALLVIGYGISINVIEVVWKHNIRIAFPSPNDYNAFMGDFSKYTGIATILLIMFTKGIVRRFGWFVGAIVTPLVTIVTGGLFFMCIFGEDVFGPIAAGMGLALPVLLVYIGAVQNIATKGTKYAHFDPTKEMAYIPLDAELKSKGKAAVDVIGGRLGKAGGSAIQQILFFALGTKEIMVIAPYLTGVVGLVVGAWALSVMALSKKYNALIAKTKS
ncbi:MAG: NTP/NDP exchange transporter [Alphaproteobacteria bacterium]|nr:NTP/NDP exchange transporter [Alphaproteobacteria bacterium]